MHDDRAWIENLLWIQTQDRETIRLRFNEAQMRLYDAYRWQKEREFPVRIIICKARRAGLSTGVEALIFKDTVSIPHTSSLIVGNQRGPASNVMDMCKTFWAKLPKAVRIPVDGGFETIPIKPPLHPKYTGTVPNDILEFAPYPAGPGSRIVIASAKSLDAYRSYAFQNIHATEASSYDNAKDLFASLTATVSDKPHTSMYVESTPKGMSGNGAWFYEQVMEANANRNPGYGEWKLVFIPWHEMPKSFSIPFKSPEKRSDFEHTLKTRERDLMRQFPHITLEQLQWRRFRIAQPPFNKDEEYFEQEYPADLVTCFLASGSRILNNTTLRRLIANTEAPAWEGDIYWGEGDDKNRHESIYNTIRRPHFLEKSAARERGFSSHTTDGTFDNLKVWRMPHKGERVIIGCDVGRGNPNTEDGDYSAICVVVMNGLQKDELIMTWRGKLNTVAFGDVCAALAWAIRYRVGDDATAPKLVIEWTGPGSSTCTYIDERKLYPLWQYRMPGVVGFPVSKHVGWESNGRTKPYAVGTMIRVLEGDFVSVPSKELIEELSSYREHDVGAGESTWGGVGSHDDLVSAFQIAVTVARLEQPIDPAEAASAFTIDQDAPTFAGGGGTEEVEAFNERDNAPEIFNLYGNEDEDDGESFWN
jgi:hypothetical protein